MHGPTGGIEGARAAIDALRSLVASSSVPRSDRPWRGAHVLITAHPLPAPLPASIEAFYGPDRDIVTEHVLELSWLFERLRDAFIDLLDGCSKLEFYGRLQLAANRAIIADNSIDAPELCIAVLSEAAVMLAELSAGTFDCLPVAPSRIIKADSGASRN